MNYIRTKDNRLFRVIKDLTYENTYHLETNTQTLTIMTEEKYLSTMGKIADTIEELCDEFVAIDIGLLGDREKHYKLFNQAITDKTFLYDRLYGAIWTDKGLIYVAKMNNKGELELL